MTTLSSAPPLRGSIIVSPTVDIARIIQAAGGDPAKCRYFSGTGMLEVNGVSQEALEAAAAAETDTLFAARMAIKARAAAELEARIAAGMPWQGKVADIDEVSTGRMTSVTVAAQVGLISGGIAWRMHDNSMLVLDAQGVVGMASAAFSYVAALRDHYWRLVDAVMAASEEAALAAVNPALGWPELPTG